MNEIPSIRRAATCGIAGRFSGQILRFFELQHIGDFAFVMTRFGSAAGGRQTGSAR
jgi:hypothetical protein